MKKIQVFTMAAMALMLGLSSCSEDNKGVEKPSAEKFNVTLSFKNAATRADGAVAASGTKVQIVDGYICFVNSAKVITDVFTIGTAPTSGKNILNTDLGATPVTLNDVPGASTEVYMVANKGTMAVVPTVGNNVLTYMESAMKVEDQSNYIKVTSSGNAPLLATSDVNKKTATINLSTQVARIQIKDIKFEGNIGGKIVGFYVNGYYPTMKINGAGIDEKSSMNAADYVAGSAIFPTTLSTFVYDEINKDIAGTVTPANGVWGYNLFASKTPQIIIKLKDVTVNGQALSGEKFVTVNGFKNSSTSVSIDKLEGGMIYTVNTGALVIKPEHLTETPGVTPISVDLTVVTVTWQETTVIPKL